MHLTNIQHDSMVFVKNCGQDSLGTFQWFDPPSDKENWTIFNLLHRGSGLLAQVNYSTVWRLLEDQNGNPPTGWNPEDWSLWEAKDWLVGTRQGFAFRVFNPDGSLTAVWAFVYENILKRLEEHPILDEDLYYQEQFVYEKDFAQTNLPWDLSDEFLGEYISYLKEYHQDSMTFDKNYGIWSEETYRETLFDFYSIEHSLFDMSWDLSFEEEKEVFTHLCKYATPTAFSDTEVPIWGDSDIQEAIEEIR